MKKIKQETVDYKNENGFRRWAVPTGNCSNSARLSAIKGGVWEHGDIRTGLVAKDVER